MAKNSKQDSNEQGAAISFDLAFFEKRLEESQLEFDSEISRSVFYKEPQEAEQTVIVAVPATTQAVPKKEPTEAPAESSFLAGLALEAQISLASKQSLDQHNRARARSVHDALDRLLKFLIPFIKHVNTVKPEINRSYRLDARTVFANLKWEDAIVDSRKQSLTDAAQLAYVAFSVNLRAPEPVLIKRPWDQFNALKKELHHLRLRTLDDLEEIHKKPKQEWLEARLDSALPVQITFQGNYGNGKIEVLTRNLAEFGQVAFRLEPDDITPTLLDELGLFLIGRTDKLPTLLCASGNQGTQALGPVRV